MGFVFGGRFEFGYRRCVGLGFSDGVFGFGCGGYGFQLGQ